MNFEGSEENAKARVNTSVEEAAPDGKEDKKKQPKGFQYPAHLRPKLKKKGKQKEEAGKSPDEEENGKDKSTDTAEEPVKEDFKELNEQEEVAVEPPEKIEESPMEPSSKKAVKKKKSKTTNANAVFLEEEEEKPREPRKTHKEVSHDSDRTKKKSKKEGTSKKKKTKKMGGSARKRNPKKSENKSSPPNRDVQKSKMERSVNESLKPSTPMQDSKRGGKDREKTVRMEPPKEPAPKKKKTSPVSPDVEKKGGFFKRMIEKGKFWSKSDCVANPTNDMITKAFVPPEYGDDSDFRPKPDTFMKEDDYSKRIKAILKEEPNERCSKKEAFIDRLPFWCAPSQRIPIPKVMILPWKLHRDNYMKAIGYNPDYRGRFYDPLEEPLASLKEIQSDVFQGGDKQEVIKENTYYSGSLFPREKNDPKEKTEVQDQGKELKQQPEDDKPNNQYVFFDLPDTLTLHTYVRKDRPSIAKSDEPRLFEPIDYTPGMVKRVKKTKSDADASKKTTE